MTKKKFTVLAAYITAHDGDVSIERNTLVVEADTYANARSAAYDELPPNPYAEEGDDSAEEYSDDGDGGWNIIGVIEGEHKVYD